MPTVFVVNNSGHDYSDAERFGEILYCTEGPLNKFDTAQMYRSLSEALLDANEDDYILMTSLTTLCCIATGMMVEQFGKVNMLLFQGGKYISRTIAFD